MYEKCVQNYWLNLNCVNRDTILSGYGPTVPLCVNLDISGLKAKPGWLGLPKKGSHVVLPISNNIVIWVQCIAIYTIV